MLHPKYRPDIDGLRAIAVASVVIYHAFPGVLPGGFIGVDIFFVISGFLISTILLQSQVAGDFSYRDFYARRIRRIFPALILVLLATLCFGWYMLLSDEFAQLGKQVTGGAAFFANFVFWADAGYFDTAAETKPLLHLWSLGIEEQFYIFWPVLLGVAWRRRWPMIRVILAIAVVSFLVNVLTIHPFRTAAFYSPASRFWELMVGGILACMRLKPAAPSRLRSHVQSFVGVGLLGLGLVMIRGDKAFPGWWALLPTLGAVSCIAAGPTGFLNKYLLSNRVMVWIGLISYPLYLWHWPLLAYARILSDGMPSLPVRAGAVVASVVLAWLTYRFVERYTRTRTSPGLLRWLAGLGIALVVVGLVVFSGVLQPRHHDIRLQQISEAAADVGYYDDFKNYELGRHLLYQVGKGSRKSLLIGDSHVQQYGPRAEELARTVPDKANTIYFATQGSCPPIPGVYADANIGCAERRTAVLEFARSPEIDTVVIGGCWNCYFIAGGAPGYYFRDASGAAHQFRGGDGMALAFDSLGQLLRELSSKGKKVYLLLDIPVSPDFEPKRLLEGSRLASMKVTSSMPTLPILQDQRELNDKLRQIGIASGVEVIDAVANLCTADGQCLRTMPDGAPAYKDAGHLRPKYTRSFATYMDRALLNDGSAALKK
ncbi:acyltransferase family protein [Variovorax sp. CCNWLW186]|uniref:acyltransferase family protein n=2 Tax=unclassified Variovorax TaxID=663243 RepID=UPI0030776497